MRTCTKCKIDRTVADFPTNGAKLHSWCRTCLRENKKRYYRNNRAQKLLEHARARARQFNLPCDISIEDIVIPTHCPYLGVELTDTNGEGRTGFNPSLDRIDPTLGYTKGNVQVISDKANTMKNNATIDQLLTFAKSMIALHGS